MMIIVYHYHISIQGIKELLKGLFGGYLGVIGGGYQDFETNFSNYFSDYFLQLFCSTTFQNHACINFIQKSFPKSLYT